MPVVWRTPASVVVERSEDFVARVEELGLEGVVAKRLGSTYIRGRRCTAWVKHKLRRVECLAMTGVRRTSDAVAKAVFVVRAARRFVGWRVHRTGTSWRRVRIGRFTAPPRAPGGLTWRRTILSATFRAAGVACSTSSSRSSSTGHSASRGPGDYRHANLRATRAPASRAGRHHAVLLGCDARASTARGAAGARLGLPRSRHRAPAVGGNAGRPRRADRPPRRR